MQQLMKYKLFKYIKLERLIEKIYLKMFFLKYYNLLKVKYSNARNAVKPKL